MQVMRLSEELDTLAKHGMLRVGDISHMTGNLSSRIRLRPYQTDALARFAYQMGREDSRHQLYHMATGSGKTILMACMILDLYARGYRNFLFFVNSTQIIRKTEENFLNPHSPKYLFMDTIRINGRVVRIRKTDSLGRTDGDGINMLFTTIQGLHGHIQNPSENAVTREDFADSRVVLISDEAHHLNAKTTSSSESEANWEQTVMGIFNSHSDNVLLEFTATAQLVDERIERKYHDKIVCDYPLRKFREDGYSKDIELRQADVDPATRMLQGAVISQYRRKVAERHGIQCKPVILMKSRTIAESLQNQMVFTDAIRGITGEQISSMYTKSDGTDSTLHTALRFVLDECGVEPSEFAREMRFDFSPDRIVNVNKPKDLEGRQMELNTLEDESNEIRVVFAVNKLNEGWDVLNLFDIIRLYNTRDGRENAVGNTTMQEAQLIGRGARYFPFIPPDRQDTDAFKRKYDGDTGHPLRILEQLHYHCAHNPRYIHDIRSALRNTGMLSESARNVFVRVKDRFKRTHFYRSESVLMNSREINTRSDVSGLESYSASGTFTYPRLSTNAVTEYAAFGENRNHSLAEPVTRNVQLLSFGRHVLRFAMDASPFFHFSSLRVYFPRLTSASEFIVSRQYLGDVYVDLTGTPERLDRLTPDERVDIARHVLGRIERAVRDRDSTYRGTDRFNPFLIRDIITDKTLKISVSGETGRSWAESEIDGLQMIDLKRKDWYVYDDNYGTDQEKHFIRFIHDRVDRLRELYSEFYLIRNEKSFQLYSFDDGRAFEPDFVLFLRRKREKRNTVIQIFVEPKGEHLMKADLWKEDFLKKIHDRAIILQGKDYSIYGLPFFNEGRTKRDFTSVFSEFESA